MQKISLSHGNGGRHTFDLIKNVFIKHFQEAGDYAADSFITKDFRGGLAFTTDSHVVKPIHFPGGDIGSLSVNGTANDLAVCAARPLYLSCGFIIEEGFRIEELDAIVKSMADSARSCGVRIVAGDTKVVEKGNADGLYINTSGIGQLHSILPSGPSTILQGDIVLVSGTVGDHGATVFAARDDMSFQSNLTSDCACVYPLIEMLDASGLMEGVRIMRDPTRGGLATTLNEFVHGLATGIELDETSIPVRAEVTGICELLGFDPVYLACEGKVVLVCDPSYADKILSLWKQHPLGRDASAIGYVTARYAGGVFMKTSVGGERILDMLQSDMLPRIC